MGKKAKPLVQEFGSYIALFTNEGDTNAAARFLNTLETSRRKVTGEEVRGARGRSGDGEFAKVQFDDKLCKGPV